VVPPPPAEAGGRRSSHLLPAKIALASGDHHTAQQPAVAVAGCPEAAARAGPPAGLGRRRDRARRRH